MPRLYKETKYTKEKIEELLDICNYSTQVNGWYTYPHEKGNIRGPWNRHIDVSPDIDDDSKDHVAPHKSDVIFIATAMNYFESALKTILEMRKDIQKLHQMNYDAAKVVEDEGILDEEELEEVHEDLHEMVIKYELETPYVS